MSVEDDKQVFVYKKEFNNPFYYTSDLDEDGIEELIVVDSIITDDRPTFYIYFFCGKQEFKLVDSIYSGTYFPFLTFASEISSIIIQTGNPDFEIFNTEYFTPALPINVWKFLDEQIVLINSEVYEPFLFENENIVRLMDFYIGEVSGNCMHVQGFRNHIASAFANYINAGEYSLADQFLNKYYPCSNKQEFKQQIIDLIFPKANQ